MLCYLFSFICSTIQFTFNSVIKPNYLVIPLLTWYHSFVRNRSPLLTDIQSKRYLLTFGIKWQQCSTAEYKRYFHTAHHTDPALKGIHDSISWNILKLDKKKDKQPNKQTSMYVNWYLYFFQQDVVKNPAIWLVLSVVPAYGHGNILASFCFCFSLSSGKQKLLKYSLR